MRRRIRSAAFPVHRHSLPQLLVDAGLVALAYWLAYKLRFDRGVPERYDRLFEETIVWVVVGSPIVFAMFGMYQKWWRYLGQRDLEQVLKGVFVSTLALVGAIAVIKPVVISARAGSVAVAIPTGVVALYLLLSLALLCGARFLVRAVLERRIRGFRPRHDARDVLIVGAGDGGQLLLREIVRNPDLRYRPVGFVDDDPRKQNMRLANGLKVLGPTTELDRVLDETSPEEVIIAIPSAPGTLRARVVMACRERGIPVRTLPTVFELLLDGGTSVVRQTREVQVEDVLGREPVRMELEKLGAYLEGKTVMVTGAGGSIGGELSRQLARVGPERLVLVDHAEDNLFAIARELAEERHVTTGVSVLADCREEERMREVFTHHRPDVVFHAAAYKHVGLMERNPIEAVRNNALATRLVAAIAGELGTEAFVLVSTDKAVSPATVMGASKALAEWALESSCVRYPSTRYSIVRFGNVLGSSGSVVPIFRRQIATGGPVTVTHEDMTRYFMTIPEAVQLIIRSGALSKGGEVFVLDMGEPVKIMDLARQMIRLSGLEPDRDIAIEIIGPRDGEKLHEELFNPYEHERETEADRILLAEREPLDPEWVERSFDRINLLVLEGDTAGLAAAVSELSAERAERTVRADPDRSMQVPH